MHKKVSSQFETSEVIAWLTTGYLRFLSTLWQLSFNTVVSFKTVNTMHAQTEVHISLLHQIDKRYEEKSGLRD